MRTLALPWQQMTTANIRHFLCRCLAVKTLFVARKPLNCLLPQKAVESLDEKIEQGKVNNAKQLEASNCRYGPVPSQTIDILY